MIKLPFSLIFLLNFFVSFGMEPLPKLVNIDFINKTGRDLIIKTVLEGESEADKSRERTIPDKDLRFSDKFPHALLEKQNLYRVKHYEVSLKNAALLHSPSQLIDAKMLDQKMAQLDAESATISFTITTSPLRTMVWLKPEITINYRTLDKEPEIIEYSERQLCNISMREVQSEDIGREREIIYGALDLPPNASPHMIFGLNEPPKATPKLDPSRQPLEVQRYLKQLESSYNSLIEKWPINPFVDIEKRKFLKIKDFTKKVQDLIEDSYRQVLRQMNAK